MSGWKHYSIKANKYMFVPGAAEADCSEGALVDSRGSSEPHKPTGQRRDSLRAFP